MANKMKLQRYWQYKYELKKEYGLTETQTIVYGCIYNHCINLNDDGYFGYTNDTLAATIGVSVSTIEKSLKALKDKKLITVKNPQKRSKKTGQSRMIYINMEIYQEPKTETPSVTATAEQTKEQAKQVHDLQTEVRNLKMELDNIKGEAPNVWVTKLVKLNFLSKSEGVEYAKELNKAYEQFIREFDYKILNNHIDYTVSKAIDSEIEKEKRIQDRKHYLLTALARYKSKLIRELKGEKNHE